MHSRVDYQVDDQGDRQNEPERQPDIFFQPSLIRSAVISRKKRSASHAKSYDDRGDEDHQRIGRADGRQRVRSEELADDQRINEIVYLLQQVSRYHRQGKLY